jgi:hypothetical protein
VPLNLLDAVKTPPLIEIPVGKVSAGTVGETAG